MIEAIFAGWNAWHTLATLAILVLAILGFILISLTIPAEEDEGQGRRQGK